MNTTPTITLEWVRKEKARHNAALADLEAAERLLLSAQAEATMPQGTISTPRPMPTGYGAKKRVLLQIVADAPNGIATQGVVAKATAAGLQNLKPGNVSPQLSGYKKQRLLDLRHGLWVITNAGRDFLASKTTGGQP